MSVLVVIQIRSFQKFQLNNHLKKNHIKTWMDIYDMGNSITDSMAEAVENAAIIIIAMTRKYQDSNWCHLGMFIKLHRTIDN